MKRALEICGEITSPKSSIYVIGVSGEEKKFSAEKTFKELIPENVPNLVQELDLGIQTQ